MTPRICAGILILASIGACGTNPIEPKLRENEFQDTTPIEPSAAKLEIRDFVVVSGYDAERRSFWYIPTLTLAETAGVSGAWTTGITLELLDIGPAGRVPTTGLPAIEVPPGGTVRLDQDEVYGDYWMYIETSRDAPRVSVTIAYRDHAGRAASVSAIAQVSR